MTLIRDLGEQAFEERFGCDRFTATVLGNRFGYLVEHMCGRLLTAAFSPILRDFYDFAATIVCMSGKRISPKRTLSKIRLHVSRTGWPALNSARGETTRPFS